jgi:hypothetical protein
MKTTTVVRITAQLESLDFATAPVFVIKGLKREELIASNSMIQRLSQKTFSVV